jgi:glycerophosphoryl diester phosphodiesterase
VVAWTVDDDAALRRAVEARLSGVISNDPRAMRRRLAAWQCACDRRGYH